MSHEFNKKVPLTRIGQLFQHGDYVNLGIGIPADVANYIPPDRTVILQSENGFLGMGPIPEVPDKDLQTAGGQPSSILKGGCFFDSVSSFTMIRGGHLDYTVLGYLEVDQEQNIANYKIPGIRFPGMGGAMDLVVGAKKVIVVGTHLDKKGESKLLKKCSLPLTGMKAVYMVVTDAALFTFKSGKFFLEEVFEPYTVDWVIE
ncbi:MAG: 3-oxoacid CoA-transferase subunit B, partial [Gammaproteobacteria bacterium]